MMYAQIMILFAYLFQALKVIFVIMGILCFRKYLKSGQ